MQLEIVTFLIGVRFIRGNSLLEYDTGNAVDPILKVDDYYVDESDQEFDLVDKLIFLTDVDVWKQAK